MRFEFVNDLQLKRFLKSANPDQVSAARALLEEDLRSGVLVAPVMDWPAVFSEVVKIADQHTSVIGCRSLDILHCAMAKVLSAAEFVSTDGRQRKLATAIGLNLISF